MRKISLVFFAIILLAGCTQRGSQGEKITAKTVIDDVCQNFTSDFVYSAIGKVVLSATPENYGQTKECTYYFSGQSGDFIRLQYEKNFSVEDQKKAVGNLGGRIEMNDLIKVDHFLAYNQANQLYNVFLILNKSAFFSIDRGDMNSLTDEQLIAFAAQVADKIRGESFLTIQTNPIQVIELSDTQEKVVEVFFNHLKSGNVNGALGLMSVSTTAKETWRKNFAELKSLELIDIEEEYLDEWTETKQFFRVLVSVQLKSGDEAQGWFAGENYRWVTIEKKANQWQVSDISSTP